MLQKTSGKETIVLIQKFSTPIRWFGSVAIICLSLFLLAKMADRWWRLNFNVDFVMAAIFGDIRKVREELDAGIPPDRSHWQGASAMAMACYSGNEEIVKLLLARGASPDGGMPQARMMRDDSIVRLLISHGAKK